MTYEEYRRSLTTKEDTGTVTSRIVNKKQGSAVEFLENSSKTAKSLLSDVKVSKKPKYHSELRGLSPDEHLETLREPVTTTEKVRAWNAQHRDSTPDPNAAFARKKRDEFCKRLSTTDPETPNKDDHLAAAIEIADEIEDMIDGYEDDYEMMDDDYWDDE